MTTDVGTEMAVTVTPAAARQLQTLIQQREDPDCALRVFVSNGGCSGMQYGMTFETDLTEEDRVFESEGVKLVVDANSYQYLAGAEVDFVDNLMGGGFAIHNPNAVRSCGCGQSFKC
jgi:iron-sulfur cluster assembly accessory protein